MRAELREELPEEDRCSRCLEKTVRATGIWDGQKAGYIYECDSRLCPTARARRAAEKDPEYLRRKAATMNRLAGVDPAGFRRFRRSHGVSLERLARRLGVDAETVRSWEAGAAPFPQSAYYRGSRAVYELEGGR